MKLQKSDIAKIAIILFLLLITPFMSRSMRPSYFYFLFNLIIIALAIESGILESSKQSQPSDDKKLKPAATSPPSTESLRYSVNPTLDAIEQPEKQPVKPRVENMAAVGKVHRFRRCPSKASLFFIGNCSSSEVAECARKKEVPELSKQELFVRAEVFIGNFYKQLKIQRESSWKKIHELCHMSTS